MVLGKVFSFNPDEIKEISAVCNKCEAKVSIRYDQIAGFKKCPVCETFVNGPTKEALTYFLHFHRQLEKYDPKDDGAFRLFFDIKE